MRLSNFAKKVVLPMLCVMALAPLAHAADDTGTSTATVGFTEGALTLTDPSKTHVNFDFLTHDLPFEIPTDSSEYPYPSNDAGIDAYSLVITDARSANEPWMLQAEMTSFAHETEPSNAFNGIVLLGTGQKAFTYSTDDTKMTILPNLELISGDDSTLPVIRLEEGGLSRDVYTVGWTPGQVSLRFTENTNVSELIEGNYEATITWTIVTDVAAEEPIG